MRLPFFLQDNSEYIWLIFTIFYFCIQERNHLALVVYLWKRN